MIMAVFCTNVVSCGKPYSGKHAKQLFIFNRPRKTQAAIDVNQKYG